MEQKIEQVKIAREILLKFIRVKDMKF